VKDFSRSLSIMVFEERTDNVLCQNHLDACLQACLMYVHTKYPENTYYLEDVVKPKQS
jgi:hypothetical protein